MGRNPDLRNYSDLEVWEVVRNEGNGFVGLGYSYSLWGKAVSGLWYVLSYTSGDRWLAEESRWTARDVDAINNNPNPDNRDLVRVTQLQRFAPAQSGTP